MYKKIKSVIRKIFSIFFTLAIPAGILFFVFYCLSNNSPNKLEEGEKMLKSNKDFKIVSEKEVKGIPDSEVFQNFSDFQKSFSDLNFSLSSNVALAQEDIPKKVEVAQDKNSLTSSYELKGVTVTTDYKKKETDEKNVSLGGNNKIKQTIKLNNHTNEDQKITFTTRTKIKADSVRWDGQDYWLKDRPQKFRSYDKTVSIPEYTKIAGQEDLEGADDFKNYEYTYKVGTSIAFTTSDGQGAVFDWSDAENFNPEVSVYIDKGGSFLEFTIYDFPVPANSEKTIDPFFALNNSSNYSQRYDGEHGDSYNQITTGDVAIGDINEDGISDLVVGSSNASFNGSSSGSVFIVFGGSVLGSGDKKIEENFDIRFDGGAAYEYLSIGGISIGDVNGDSQTDLVIGASQADYNGTDSGSAYVFYSTFLSSITGTGNIKSLSTSSNYNIRFDGGMEYDYLAQGGIVIGDVNGDSQADLIIGSYKAPNYSEKGYAYIFYSTLLSDIIGTGNIKSLGTSSNYNIRIESANYDYLTRGGIVVGDVNGDSQTDLVIGATWAYYNNGYGSAYIFYSTLLSGITGTGNIKSLDTSSNYSIRFDGENTSNQALTSGGITIGDVNGDGDDDLVLGDYGAVGNGSSSGSAYIFYSTLLSGITGTGNIKSLSTSSNYNIRIDGGAASEYLTRGGIKIGDVNEDSQTDLLIGTFNADYNGTDSGSVYIFYSTLLSGVTGTGNVMPLSTSSNYNIRIDGGAASEYLTYGEIVIGDINGDDETDLVLGAYNASNNGSYSGSAYVFYSTLLSGMIGTGNTAPLSTSSNYNIRFDGGAANDQLTQGGIIIGDINGNEKEDLMIGTPYTDYNGDGSGSAYLFFSSLLDDFGSTTGNNVILNSTSNYSINYYGSNNHDYLSRGGVYIDDINEDGEEDLIIGAYEASNNGYRSGSVYIKFGGSSNADTGNKPFNITSNYDVRFDGGAAGDQFAYGGISTGDVNGDNEVDLIIGAPYADYNGTDSGSAYVFYSTLLSGMIGTGNTAPLSTSSNYNIRFDGGAANECLAVNRSITIGDVNEDSQTDLVIGAYKADYNGTDSGSAYVFYSTLLSSITGTGNVMPLSTSSNYNIRFDGGAASEYLTLGGIVIGDVNRNSKKDLMICAHDASYNGSQSGSVYVIFSNIISGITGTGNVKTLNTSSNYNIRFNGGAAGDSFGDTIAVGDINGDAMGDLVIAAIYTNFHGNPSWPNLGSVYIFFSDLISGVGTSTGNIKTVSTTSNYNVRYSGEWSYSYLGRNSIVIGDVNGDGNSDLLFGALSSNPKVNDYVYTTYSGSEWVIYSTLLASFGSTTGRYYDLYYSPSAFNIRFDGGGTSYQLSEGPVVVGDIDGDSKSDLVVGILYSSYNGSQSGSVHVFHSTFFSNITTSGNLLNLGTSPNYDTRFDGGAANDQLTSGGIAIGDVNGDGAKDLAVGSYYADNNGFESGSVYVFFSEPFAPEKVRERITRPIRIRNDVKFR